ncbi:hypothetical protein BU15DRAFT_43592 [Melanogaster broomeanus]|nr:hypothetical protein BU15DRAFT_43592 [Melanogaster broomeanus]
MLAGISSAHHGDGPNLSKGPATRRDEKLKGAKTLLTQWRYEAWKAHCSKAPYGPQGLLPDEILNKIALSTRLLTVEDLRGTGWGRCPIDRHGAALLEVLATYDKKFDEVREIEKAERAEAKKQEMAERRAAQQAAVKAECE